LIGKDVVILVREKLSNITKELVSLRKESYNEIGWEEYENLI